MPKTIPFDPNMSTGRGWLLVPSGQFCGSFLWHKRWKMLEEIRMLLLKRDGWRKYIEDDCLKTTIHCISLYIEDTVIKLGKVLLSPSRPCWSSLDILLAVQHQLAPLPNPAFPVLETLETGGNGNPNVFLRSGVQISWKTKFTYQLLVGWGERQIIPLTIAGNGLTKHKR